MRSSFVRPLGVFVVTLAMASISSAAVITQWGFNQSSGTSNPTVGTGSAYAGYGVAPGGGLLPPLTSLLTGSPADPGQTNTPPVTNNRDMAFGNSIIPTATATSGSLGFKVLASTAGYHNVSFSWDMSIGWRTSRYYQLMATTDGGTTWANVPAGTGSTPSVLGGNNGTPFSTYSFANVSNTGLVDIRANFLTTNVNLGVSANYPSGVTNGNNGDSYISHLTYTFPDIYPGSPSFDNNPNFGVALVAVYGPGNSAYVSSYAGTTGAADTTMGYLRSSSTSGTIRVDYLTISGIVPEPASIGAIGMAGLLTLARRRKASR